MQLYRYHNKALRIAQHNTLHYIKKTNSNIQLYAAPHYSTQTTTLIRPISTTKSPRFTDPEGLILFSQQPTSHLSLAGAKLTQSALSHIFIQHPFNIILNLYLGFPSSLFPSRFLTKTLYFSPHMQYAPPKSSSLIYNGNGAWQEARSPPRKFTHPPTIYSPSGGQILPSTPYSPTAANHFLHLNERQSFATQIKQKAKLQL